MWRFSRVFGVLATLSLVQSALLRTSVGGAVAWRGARNATSAAQWRQPVVQRAVSAVVALELGGQSVDLLLDTGSFDLLLASALCESCGGHVFRTGRSKSFRFGRPLEKRTFHFGSGDIAAVKGYDNLTVGPYNAVQLPFWLISSELSKEVRSVWPAHEFDGVLGLGLKRSTVPERLGVNSFSLCLTQGGTTESWGASGSALSGGFLHWNGRDESLPWGESQPVAQSVRDSWMHWELRAPYINLGHERLCGRECRVALDAGTGLLAVPADSAQRLAAALPEIPPNCSLSGLPHLRMDLPRGGAVELPPSAYVTRLGSAERDTFAELARRGRIVWRESRNASSASLINTSSVSPPTGGCAALFMVSAGPRWILGLPLFREYSVHFDRLQRRVSLAENHGGRCEGATADGGDALPASVAFAGAVHGSRVQPDQPLLEIKGRELAAAIDMRWGLDEPE